MGILSKINGSVVIGAGFSLAVIASMFNRSIWWYPLGIAIAGILWLVGKDTIGKWKAFDNFADPKYWPTFVTFGVVSLMLAPPGKRLMTAAIWMILDGMYFAQNY